MRNSVLCAYLILMWSSALSTFSAQQQMSKQRRIENNKVAALEVSTKKDQTTRLERIYGTYSREAEVQSKRSENVKHFRNPDGSFTAQIGGNYHYKDQQGQWQDIDLSIESGVSERTGYSYKSVKNKVKSYFPQYANNDGLIMNLESGKDFSWWRNPSLSINSNGSQKDVKKAIVQQAKAKGESIVYPQVHDGISEEFVMLDNGVEHNTIIDKLSSDIKNAQQGATLEFSQFIPLGNTYKVIDAKGQVKKSDFDTKQFSIELGDPADHIYFGNILVFDANTTKEDALLVNLPSDKLTAQQKLNHKNNVLEISYRLIFVDGGVKVIAKLPVDWLKVSHRSFPVTIDPTVTIMPPNSEGYFAGPLTHWYGYQRYANIYLQSELGISSGIITAIEYNSTDNGVAGSTPTKVYMKSTTANTLAGGKLWNSTDYTGNAQLCLDANTDQGDTTGWKMLTFTNAYNYDGSNGNLMIMVYDAWGGEGSAKGYNQSESVLRRQAFSCHDDTDPGDSTTLAVENRLSEIRITYSLPPNCAAVPTNMIAQSSVPTTCLASSFTLSIKDFTLQTGLAVQWQKSTDNGVTWQNLGSSQATNVLTVNGQATASQYKAIVTCTLSGNSSTTAPVSVGLSPTQNCYCTNTIPLNCREGDFIGNVTFGNINNNSGCGNTTTGYSNYTTTVAPAIVAAGSTVPISVKVGPSSDGWMYESVGVWIDYNHNGVLDESEGEFTNVGTGLDQVLTKDILIPSTALSGETRMRVVLIGTEKMTNDYACGPKNTNISFGEMEDYTINIVAPLSITMSSTNLNCNGGNNATATVAASGGVAPYTYLWDDAAAQTTATATGLIAGNYSVKVTDANQNSMTKSVTITQPAAVAAPTGNATQSFNQNDTLAALVVNGQNIKWYATQADAQSHTNVLPSTTVIINDTTYYATQTVGQCESNAALAVKAYNPTLAVGANNKTKAMILYPNPVKDIINLKTDEKIESVDIFSIDGKKLMNKARVNTNNQLNVHNLPQGVYIIQVKTETKTEAIKFTKQ
ncbi:GEVED domain-containing protein [Soonwooa sp.]|uniref:GEVED domain-containing protein n=1 Tax=Soonwooa sp. TaxID=1938592 RepID=UPI00261423F1|nr:GEVED domain-containing protein [Soonwooa sp.]